ncbi:Choline-sulfatase [Planctomycetes bacterium Pla163]|uniref:Choline-sulfatase n=1 Tax=Rohdeia mirabilis TaxID=2528008 RepID=A0A518CVN2_9BACT|nr:Choline-sulfatase [Planctomycetes bacterium Pla163]
MQSDSICDPTRAASGRSERPASHARPVATFAALALLALAASCGGDGGGDDGRAPGDSPGGASSATRPNVLFISIDDLRCELPAYGSEHVLAPNLTAFADRALTFERAYCQFASCCPSRTSVLTGVRPDTSGVHDQDQHFRDTLPDVVTLPQHFKEHGWTTRAVGKVHHGNLVDERSWSEPWMPIKDEVVQYADSAIGVAARGRAFEAAAVDDGTFHDGLVARRGVEALTEFAARSGGGSNGGEREPFFLALGFLRPHLPFVAPQRYFDAYPLESIELASYRERPAGAPSNAILDGAELRMFEGVPDGPLPDELARELRRAYWAATSYVDAQVGLVLDALDRLGLADDTVVVIWSDHGYKLGEFGAWCKKTTVELDTRVPLLLRAPGVTRAGSRTAGLVELVDLYPTLAEVCGLPLPAHLEGTSFAPLLVDPERAWKSAVFSQQTRGAVPDRMRVGLSMRTERYRLTRWVRMADRDEVLDVELYDHTNDPLELVDVSDATGREGELAALTEQLLAGWSAVRDDVRSATEGR